MSLYLTVFRRNKKNRGFLLPFLIITGDIH